MFMGKIEAAGDTRQILAQMIANRLSAVAESMQAQWQVPGRIRSAYVDDLLPDPAAHAVRAAFPTPEGMMLKRSFRENKHVAAQMDAYDPLLEDAVYAFQHPAVVEQVTRITGLAAMEPDSELYAGGISAMGEGAYLRPHLDNSHDRERHRRGLRLAGHPTKRPGRRRRHRRKRVRPEFDIIRQTRPRQRWIAHITSKNRT